jgi:hypothetical protein
VRYADGTPVHDSHIVSDEKGRHYSVMGEQLIDVFGTFFKPEKMELTHVGIDPQWDPEFGLAEPKLTLDEWKRSYGK